MNIVEIVTKDGERIIITLVPYDIPSRSGGYIIGTDSRHAEVWRVVPKDHNDFFVDLEIDDDVVRSHTWSGFLYEIQGEDGKVLTTTFVK